MVRHTEHIDRQGRDHHAHRHRERPSVRSGRVAAVTAQGFTEMQGGFPIVVEGEVIGAIGASFDTPEHDVQIAQAGLAVVRH
jgi:glc operon protein GlcG